MTHNELRAILSLSSIMSLRMIGLFMVLPVFALYASELPHATPTLIGLAMGTYGLAQALLQIPFGIASDHVGRKPIICMGLAIFILGSLLCAISHSIEMLILGRTLQGAGAVGGTMLAMMADLTREEERTKAMAITGITIGASFMLAILLGPILTNWVDVSGLFYVAASMGLLGIILLYTVTPTPSHDKKVTYNLNTSTSYFWQLVTNPALAKLNSGIFILHAIFTASFIVIPINLLHLVGMNVNEQWHLYAPALIMSLIVSFYCIGKAERNGQVHHYFIGSIVTLICALLILWLQASHFIATAVGLCLFLAGFSLLEAFLPSLISRTAPAEQKGSAMGIYSCSQFLGIFSGGTLGGWFYGHLGFSGVYLFCLFLSLCWLFIAFGINPDFIRRKEPLQSN